MVRYSSCVQRLMTGFDMSTMGTTYFDEGQIDINEDKEVVTNEFIIKASLLSVRLKKEYVTDN